jgi:hypothetical protein
MTGNGLALVQRLLPLRHTNVRRSVSFMHPDLRPTIETCTARRCSAQFFRSFDATVTLKRQVSFVPFVK